MKRYVFLLALATVAVWADGASAFFRRWCAPPAYVPYGYGYRGYAAPLYRPYAVPIYGVPLAPPQIYQAPPTGTAPKAQAPTQLQPPVVTVTPGIVLPMVKPEVDPMVKPAAGGLATPMPAPAPMTPIMIPDPMVPVKPLPIPDPMVTSKPPPLVLPPIPGSDDKPLSTVIPNAIPMPAPAPMAPKTGDPLPTNPLPQPLNFPPFGKDSGKGDLPPLVLPPETPGSPSGVIPPVTTRSSPLTGALKVQVFTAAGTPDNPLLRKVGFFNHTDRDLDLVIEGKAVKLPKKSFLNAELPAKFTWKHSGGTAEVATVPAGAAGLDMLFKE